MFRNKRERKEEKHSDSQKVMKNHQQQHYQFCISLKFALGKMIESGAGEERYKWIEGRYDAVMERQNKEDE